MQLNKKDHELKNDKALVKKSIEEIEEELEHLS